MEVIKLLDSSGKSLFWICKLRKEVDISKLA